MASNFDKKALRGSVPQVLLEALVSGEKYGYEICKEIEQKSNGKIVLKQPSLYSSLRRMEDQGLIDSYWDDSDLGGRRHYYKITEKGKNIYERNKRNWKDTDALYSALANSYGISVETPIVNNDKYEEDSINQEDFSVADETVLDENSSLNNNEDNNTVDNNEKDSKDSFSVLSQENLFNIVSLPRFDRSAVKKLESDDEQEKSNSYMQMDLFEVASQQSNNLENLSIKDNTQPMATASDFIKNFEPTDLTVNEDNEKSNVIDNFFSGIPNDNVGKADNEDAVSFKFKKLENTAIVANENFDEAQPFLAPRKSLTEFKEVLSDEERLDIKTHTDMVKSYNPYDYNPMVYTSKKNKNKNSLLDEKPPITVNIEPVQTESKNEDELQQSDYKNVLGNLYSGTKLDDPYEITKKQNYEKILKKEDVIKDYKTILDEDNINIPTLESNEVKAFDNSKMNIRNIPANINIDEVSYDFKNEGIKVRQYSPLPREVKNENFINYYRIKFIQSWVLWLFMLIEIGLTYYFLNENGMIFSSQTNLYFWALGAVSLYPAYYSFAYAINKNKNIEFNFKFNISIFNKFLAMLITIVFIFAINLLLGMNTLNQTDYLTSWLLPSILSTNYLLSSVIFYILV